MRVPAFWYRPFGFVATALSPLSILYKMGSWMHRSLANPKSIDIPVICIGNVTIGGAGKTPCVAAMAKLLHQKGFEVHILSRGYGGCLKGPVQINPNEHTAQEVGDEPLILAHVVPTWVAKNRYEGAKAARTAGAEIILMDDGLQNYELRKDFCILVIDSKLEFGNGAVLPAGPLRESKQRGIAKADVIFVTNPQKKMNFYQPTYTILTHIVASDITKIANKKIFAFSGIAHPQKFYDSLKALKLDVVGTRDFSDHHIFTENELQSLENEARKKNSVLVTTEKDWVRLNSAWRNRVSMIRIENEIQESDRLYAQLRPLLERKAA
jgi:tetraacyldisaccharide 4'-kinase